MAKKAMLELLKIIKVTTANVGNHVGSWNSVYVAGDSVKLYTLKNAWQFLRKSNL